MLGRGSRPRTVHLVCASCALAALLALPSAASARDCSIDNENPLDYPDPGGNEPALLDSGGYEFDVSPQRQAAPGHGNFEDFATPYDGGSETTTTPAGPRNADDSWDSWGTLFVGPGGDANVANEYFSADDESCTREDGDRELVFPALPLNGLTVQRKLFVASSGMPGGRLLQLLTNIGRAPVTTAVQIGDTFSNDNYGDLGSDEDTAVRASSSGDASFTPADLWLTTSDHSNTGINANSDLALAHVIGGPGAHEVIDFATLIGHDTDPADNLAWRWDNVILQPGQTIALVVYEIEQGVAGGNAAAEDAAAASQAQAYEGAPPTTLFAGMTKSEQAAVANWATPVKCAGRPVTISGSDVRDVIVGTRKPDVIWAGSGNDKVKGKKGNDRICGGPGKDKLIGGGGAKDVLKGGGGKDVEKQ
jgi:Ca2+-binding RTX toxin-like protein